MGVVVAAIAGLFAWTFLEYALHDFAGHRPKGRTHASREHLRHHADLSRVLVALKRRTTATLDQSMHCTYEDGREIPDADMDHLREVIWRNMVAYRWERGDVVAIDNRSVSHGRLPYRGERSVAVCWA